jgi:hypothetical protein
LYVKSGLKRNKFSEPQVQKTGLTLGDELIKVEAIEVPGTDT